MSCVSTKDIIKNGLHKKYPLLQLSESFQQFLDTEEYDSDLIREDITDEEDVILEHLLSIHPKLDKNELNETLRNLLDNLNCCSPPNNAEPHPIDDNSIHRSLQQSQTSTISSNTSVFSPYLYDITTLNIDLNEEKARVKYLISKYCPSLLGNEDSHNSYLIFMQTMCFILQKPFNSWVMDLFDRFKIDYGLKPIDPLHFAQICPNFGKYLTELEDVNEKQEIDFNAIIPNAIQKYNQIRPTLDFKPAHKICDNYYQFVSNVIAMNGVISRLVTKSSIHPFQFDVWFIPNEVSDSEEEKKQLDDDIEEALLETYGEQHYEVHQLIWKQTQKHKEKRYHFDIKEHNKIMQWMDDIWMNKSIEINRNMRYVLVIDRRRRSNANDIYCLLHVYRDRIEENTASYFDEEFFEKSKRFVFVTEDENERDWGLYDDHALLFGLSYHILSNVSVKMYWNVMNQKTRFKLSDLTTVWPLYFDKKVNDFSPLALGAVNQIMNETQRENALKDLEFEQFYQCITGYSPNCDPCVTDTYESMSEVSEVSEVSHHEMSEISTVLLWLEGRDLTDQYPSYFVLFKKALTELFDETDFEIDCVLDELSYFYDGEANESEILPRIKANSDEDYNEYVEALIHDLKTYISMGRDIEPKLELQLQPQPQPQPQPKAMVCSNTNTNKHFVYYCDGECGNALGKYLFGDIVTKKQKLMILSSYFWSFDYENRKQLISLLTETYELTQSQAIHHLLSELGRATVFVDDDEKWIKTFDDVFKFNSNESQSISYALSQITCRKNGTPLMAELIDNKFTNDERKRLQINVDRIRKLNKLNLNASHAPLSNDEISVLYMMANRDGFARLKAHDTLRTSCEWKSFYLNLISALNKLKQYRYHFKVPRDLYHSVNHNHNHNHHREDMNLDKYLNRITLWYSNKVNTTNINGMLHLKRDEEDEKTQKPETMIQIIPIEWIVNTGNDAETNNLFMILPFKVGSISSSDTIALSCCESMDIIAL